MYNLRKFIVLSSPWFAFTILMAPDTYEQQKTTKNKLLSLTEGSSRQPCLFFGRVLKKRMGRFIFSHFFGLYVSLSEISKNSKIKRITKNLNFLPSLNKSPLKSVKASLTF